MQEYLKSEDDIHKILKKIENKKNVFEEEPNALVLIERKDFTSLQCPSTPTEARSNPSRANPSRATQCRGPFSHPAHAGAASRVR